jgi:uncharacterized tellurite resistance protein B-like protein
MLLHTAFPDFVLFLYVHMSHVDNDYHPTELKLIKEKMARLFPEGTDMERTLYNTIRAYNNFDKSQIPDLIKDSFQHFSQVEFAQKDKIYTDIYDIINADGKVDASETSTLKALRQIIDVGTGAPKAS